MKFDHGVLAKANQSAMLDFKSWIDDSYHQHAYEEMDVDYAADQAVIVDPKTANAGLPNEIWHASRRHHHLSADRGFPEGGRRA